MPTNSKIIAAAGHTYPFEVYWETAPVVRIPIKAITCPFGAARIETSAVHGLTENWRAAVVNVQQPKQINAKDPNDIQDEEYHRVTIISPTVVELNDLNIGDLKPYTADGFLQFNTPMPLTGVAVRFRMYDRRGGMLLASNQSSDGALNILTSTVDVASRRITCAIPSTASSSLGGRTGWFDVEAVTSDTPPVVTQLVYGDFSMEKE